jgi:hypothetical protein
MMTGAYAYQSVGDWPGYLAALGLLFVWLRESRRARKTRRGQPKSSA